MNGSTRLQRSLIGLMLLLALSPFLFAQAKETPAPEQYFEGKVVPLSEVLDKAGIKLDPDAAATWYALVANDSKIYPLIKDDGARMFFKDKRILNRPMRLTARRFADTNMIQVINVHSRIKGELNEVFYWCDICSIKRFENKECDCCGAPMVLREEPLKK